MMTRNLFILLLLAVCAVLLIAAAISMRPRAYRGPVSDHFDGARFFNAEPEHSAGDTIKWLWEMKTVDWPGWIDDPHHPPPPETVPAGALRVTHINHATVLLQLDGLNILTDPIWSKRAGIAPWLGVRRVRDPGVAFDDLPPIDVVLISHDHFDHLDVPTVKRLNEIHHPLFIVGLGVRAFLESKGVQRVIELDWWQPHELPGSTLRLTFVPARHGSGRMPLSANRTLWGGFLIDSPGGQVYFAGDSGWGSSIDKLAQEFDRIRLAVLPIGSYEKRWFMKSQHFNPEDAVRLLLKTNARQAVGMHYGTFAEHPEQDIQAHELDLARALRECKVPPSRFWILSFGEGRDVPPLAEDGVTGGPCP
ncbi:MAG: MBL fold metallo-hydrolase [Acidobacteriota bacterium]